MRELLKHRNYSGSIETSLQDECLYGKILFIRDSILYEGATVPELKEAFISAVDDYLETCKELDREPQKPFSGSFNVRVGSELHEAIARAAYADGVRLNDFVKSALSGAIEQSKIAEYAYSDIHRTVIEVPFDGDILNQESSDQWIQTTCLAQSH